MENKKFYVIMWNFNKDMIEHYDVLPYLRNKYKESKKNKYKKTPTTLDEFKTFVEKESMYQFWSRCEYEMIIHGWPARKNDYKIDIHEQIMMNIDVVAKILYEEFVNKQ